MTISDDETRPASTSQAELLPKETLPSSVRLARQTGKAGISTPDSGNDEEEVQPRRGRGCARRGVVLGLIGLLLLCALAGLSAWGGYRSAVEERKISKATDVARSVQTQYALAMKDLSEGRSQLAPTRFAWFKEQPLEARTISQEVALELQVQFQLGVRDMEEKRYVEARQRFEWILEWDPSYPGITEKLADVFYQVSVTATPTPIPPTPTPSPTPTPDLRDVQKLFTDAQLGMLGGNWSVAIDTLLSLRKRDSAYYPVQVDGMLYVALRYRGMDKIYGNGKTDATITKVDLEGGMYDLQLAEAFGPLDRDAQTARRRAQWYVTGLSTWGVDWPKSIAYFEMLANEAPYFLDAENWPAIERFRMALMSYGDWLANKGDCQGAQVQYTRALELGPNAKLEATATAMVEKCPTVTPTLTPPGTITGTVTSTPTLTPTIPGDTPVPGEATPTPTPTPTPPQALTPTPTETPTFGENTPTPTPTETLTPEAVTLTPTPTETQTV